MLYLTIPVVVILIILSIKAIFPQQTIENIDEEKLKKNAKKYYARVYQEQGGGLIVFLSTIVMMFLTVLVGIILQKLIQPPEGVMFYFQFDVMGWALIGFGLGLGVVPIVINFFDKKDLKSEYPLYLEYTNRLLGIRIVKVICLSMVIVCIISSALALNVSLSVTEDRVFINDFFDITAKEYLIKDFDQIIRYTEKKSAGNIREEFVLYNDGVEVWKTTNISFSSTKEEINQMMKFLELKSGLTITEGGSW